MQTSGIAEAQRAPRSARQQERDEDEARWEARLRHLTRQKQWSERSASVAAVESRTTSLELASKLTPHDAVLLPRALPRFTGDEHEDVVCGRCRDLIGSQISPCTIRRRHPEGKRLVIRCLCGAFNLLFGKGSPGR